MCSIMPSANSDDFISSFPVCISFYSLIAMARTSKTMLNESGKSAHLCFVLDLKENVLSFLLLSMMLAVGLSYLTIIYRTLGLGILMWVSDLLLLCKNLYSASILQFVGSPPTGMRLDNTLPLPCRSCFISLVVGDLLLFCRYL